MDSYTILLDEEGNPINSSNPLPTTGGGGGGGTQDTNQIQIGGSNVSVNSGTTDAGTQRVIIASDQDRIPTSARLQIASTDVDAANPVPVEIVDGSPYTPTFTTALSSAVDAASSATTFFKMYGKIDTTAATSLYYIQILDAASKPADGAVTHLVAPIEVNHTNGTSTAFDLDLTGSARDGVSASNGVQVVVSTTEFTKTEAGNVMSVSVFTE